MVQRTSGLQESIQGKSRLQRPAHSSTVLIRHILCWGKSAPTQHERTHINTPWSRHALPLSSTACSTLPISHLAVLQQLAAYSTSKKVPAHPRSTFVASQGTAPHVLAQRCGVVCCASVHSLLWSPKQLLQHLQESLIDPNQGWRGWSDSCLCWHRAGPAHSTPCIMHSYCHANDVA